MQAAFFLLPQAPRMPPEDTREDKDIFSRLRPSMNRQSFSCSGLARFSRKQYCLSFAYFMMFPPSRTQTDVLTACRQFRHLFISFHFWFLFSFLICHDTGSIAFWRPLHPCLPPLQLPASSTVLRTGSGRCFGR